MSKNKIITSVIIVGMSALMLAGCGGAKPNVNMSGNAMSSVVSGSSVMQPIASAPETAWEVYDVGEFTIQLPDGWKAFPQQDIFGEKDADGNYPIDTGVIYVSNQAQDELDLLSKPYISFNFSKPDTMLVSGRDFYENVEDLTDVSVAGASVEEAFVGDSSLGSSVWTYQVLSLKYDDGQMVVSIPTVADNNETGLSWYNPGILDMIESVVIK